MILWYQRHILSHREGSQKCTFMPFSWLQMIIWRFLPLANYHPVVCLFLLWNPFQDKCSLSGVKHTTKKNHEKLIIRWGVNAYGRSPTVKYPFFYGFPFKRFATFGCGQSSISLWSVPRNVKPFSLFQSPGWITQTHHHLNLINSDHVGFGPDRQTTAAVGILKCVRCEENHDYNRISKVASEIGKRKVVWTSPF